VFRSVTATLSLVFQTTADRWFVLELDRPSAGSFTSRVVPLDGADDWPRAQDRAVAIHDGRLLTPGSRHELLLWCSPGRLAATVDGQDVLQGELPAEWRSQRIDPVPVTLGVVVAAPTRLREARADPWRPERPGAPGPRSRVSFAGTSDETPSGMPDGSRLSGTPSGPQQGGSPPQEGSQRSWPPPQGKLPPPPPQGAGGGQQPPPRR
jgi:hypothetical protein